MLVLGYVHDYFVLMMQSIGDEESVVSSSRELQETAEGFTPIFFEPRDLSNLVPIDEMESLCPLMDMKVCDRSH